MLNNTIETNSLTVAELRYITLFNDNKNTIKYLSLINIDNDSLVIKKEDKKNINYTKLCSICNIIDITSIDKKFYDVLNIMYYNYNNSMKDCNIEYFLKDIPINIERYIKHKNFLLNRKTYNGDYLKYKPKEVKNINFLELLGKYLQENNIKTLVKIKVNNEEEFKIINKELRNKICSQFNIYDRTEIDYFLLNEYPYKLKDIDEDDIENIIKNDIIIKYPNYNIKYYNFITKKIINNYYNC